MPVNANATCCNDLLIFNDRHPEEVETTPQDNVLKDISAAHLVASAVIQDFSTKCFGLCQS